ncbi:uncharacterized protein LOC121423795 [Lytechinus variegatus]|uniref:uncharacterized protein LOC121423795 n=1 Tax=Lytechinus variegatus TaxID=7654 RepID=UPI001BB213AB|nr:uncharacterized protein LOC121423795 [Lytechinus variegatus]
MGAGAGKNPVVGVPLNPRVELADKESKKAGGGESVLIDAPALIDLGHGTVRYRRNEDQKEKHETADQDVTVNKKGYFYHSRLDDYSEAAIARKDDKYKFRYVYKGAPSTRGKKLFYVYGIGMNSKDARSKVTKQYKPKGKGYIWPSSFRNPAHFYYELVFKEQEEEIEESEEESTDVQSKVDPEKMTFQLKDSDTVEVLKKRAAIRLLTPFSNLHISHKDDELGNADNIGKRRTEEQGEFERFVVELQRV